MFPEFHETITVIGVDMHVVAGKLALVAVSGRDHFSIVLDAQEHHHLDVRQQMIAAEHAARHWGAEYIVAESSPIIHQILRHEKPSMKWVIVDKPRKRIEGLQEIATKIGAGAILFSPHTEELKREIKHIMTPSFPKDLYDALMNALDCIKKHSLVTSIVKIPGI